MRRLVVLFAVLLFASACGGSPDSLSDGAPPPTPLPTASGDAEDPTSGPASGACLEGTPESECDDIGAEPVEEVAVFDGEVVDERAVSFQSGEVVADGHAVLVTWMSGVAPCTVLADVTVGVDREAREVAVSLIEGTDADERDTACIEIAKRKQYRVEMDEDVAGFDVVNVSA